MVEVTSSGMDAGSVPGSLRGSLSVDEGSPGHLPLSVPNLDVDVPSSNKSIVVQSKFAYLVGCSFRFSDAGKKRGIRAHDWMVSGWGASSLVACNGIRRPHWRILTLFDSPV